MSSRAAISRSSATGLQTHPRKHQLTAVAFVETTAYAMEATPPTSAPAVASVVTTMIAVSKVMVVSSIFLRQPVWRRSVQHKHHSAALMYINQWIGRLRLPRSTCGRTKAPV